MSYLNTFTDGLVEYLSGVTDPVVKVFYANAVKGMEYIEVSDPQIEKDTDFDGTRPDVGVTNYRYEIRIYSERAPGTFDGPGSLPTARERVYSIAGDVWEALHGATIANYQLFPVSGEMEETSENTALYMINCYIHKPERLQPCRS